MTKNTIEQSGIVTQVADTFIIVTIQSQTACAGCHAKGACGMSEMALKSITAEKPDEDVKIGDKVIVCASTQNAMLSVLLAYIVPSALIILILTLLILAGVNEVMAATLSLVVTSIYFICLYLLRNKFAKKIKFKVKIA